MKGWASLRAAGFAPTPGRGELGHDAFSENPGTEGIESLRFAEQRRLAFNLWRNPLRKRDFSGCVAARWRMFLTDLCKLSRGEAICDSNQGWP